MYLSSGVVDDPGWVDNASKEDRLVFSSTRDQIAVTNLDAQMT
jgi:hypothetical protein